MSAPAVVEPVGGPPSDPDPDPVLALADTVADAVRAYDRDDLLAPLQRVREQYGRTAATVVVIGEFKQGKSTLVDAMLGTDACPVDDDIATSAPVLVRHGGAPRATVLAAGDDASTTPTEISVHDVARYATDRGDRSDDVVSVEVELPRALLRDGLVLVDTPGVGGLCSQHGEAAIAMLDGADAVLIVSDASQELTATELEVVRRAVARTPRVALVVTKTDLHPAWRRIVELDRGHLDRAGLQVPVIAVASPLRLLAVSTGDTALNVESGYPELLAHLRSDVLGAARAERRLAVLDELRRCVDALAAPFGAEVTALDQPDRARELLDGLAAAEHRAAALTSAGSRWQVTLHDGVADLGSDIDHELRRRLRDTAARIVERIDQTDPAKHWDHLERWIRQVVTEQVVEVHTELRRRADDLAAAIADLFLEQHAAIGHGAPSSSPTLPTSVAPLGAPAAGDGSVVRSGLTVLRGGYGGMAMFGVVGGLFGLTLLLPVTAGLGVVMGGRAFGDERKRQLAHRRQQARVVARAYVDDATAAASKSLRDSVRSVHRTLRDAWSVRAGELLTNAQRSVRGAREASELAGAAATARRRDVDAELRRLRALGERIDRLSAAAVSRPVGGPAER